MSTSSTQENPCPPQGPGPHEVPPGFACPQIPLMSLVTASLSPGVPFPIIVAWAIGKLYYDNEK